jgi:[acyl-carrier-protein] S-malonyltransferase
MSAVVGGDESEVLSAIRRAGLTPANMNSVGQIVAAGSREGLDSLAANPPEKARVIPLAVAGAFHTSYMEPAREGLAKVAQTISPADPMATLLSNKDGQAVASGAECLGRLVSQVTSPVRWADCMESLAAGHVSGVLELCPSGVLLGLVKRGLREAERLGLDSSEGVAEAQNFATAHMGKA